MDLFGGLLASPVRKSPAVRTRPRPIAEDLVIDSGGLFDLVEVLSGARYQARFHSGASSYYDALGLVRAGRPVGAVATLLNPFTMHLLRKYATDGGAVFVDSGAFGAFQAWLAGTRSTAELDFDEVFGAYDAFTQGLTSSALGNVWLVMPDIIADHGGSLSLLERFKGRIRGYMARGVNVIVPIQRGPCRAGDTAERVFQILGSRKLVLGIPSKAAAMDISDVASIRHNRFHILGRCALTLQLYARTYALLESNPGAVLTCDANRIRACLPNISYEHATLIEEGEGGEWTGCYDDTELPYEVMHTPRWMTVRQIEGLAKALGVRERSQIKRWITAHRSPDGLRGMIEDVDADGVMLTSYAIPTVFGTHARDHLSARLRAEAVERVFRT